MRVSEQLSQVAILLKDTTHPGNIGAAARAMKTMGITRLSLVAARTRLDDTAQAMAASAKDLLAQAAWHDTLPPAIAGFTHVYAFSARRRGMSPRTLTPRAAAAEAIARVRGGGRAAFLFGGETSGLENEDVLAASALVEIPANPQCTSLNLAQAVQIACYELRLASVASVASVADVADDADDEKTALPPRDDMPTQEEFAAMMAHLGEALTAIGLPKKNDTRPLLPRLRRLLTRAEPDASEVRLLRGVWRAILRERDEQ